MSYNDRKDGQSRFDNGVCTLLSLDSHEISGEIAKSVDRLIDIDQCVLCFDKSLIEQLPEIMVERFGIRHREDAAKSPELTFLLQHFESKVGKAVDIGELPSLLMNAGIDSTIYPPQFPSDAPKNDFEKWTNENASQSREDVLALQKDLGMGAHNATKQRYAATHAVGSNLRPYLRSVTTPDPTLIERLFRLSFWEVKFKIWSLSKRISFDFPSLSVGPRWITEIQFFREIVGFQQHIGLDLFSDDKELVKAGDMHEMPFESGAFGFVFVKNTTDKSYDVRKFVSELVRVTRPNGVIIIDQICGHGGVSPLHRTDVQKAKNLLLLFEARAKLKVLVCKDLNISHKARDGSTNNVRLAVQIV